MRQNARNSYEEDNGDAYWSPPEAVAALVHIEVDRMPGRILEPCVGNGAIANELQSRGYIVWGADVKNWGWRDLTIIQDYLTAAPLCDMQGVVSNPPYRKACAFVEKAIGEYPYVAMLLRIGFLESMDRKEFLTNHPPSRILIPSRRLPMMHREGWEGKRAPSNVCHPWFIWDKSSQDSTRIIWYDWKDYS